MGEPLAVLEGVTKRFPRREEPAIDRLAFSVSGGGITAVVGPDGAGKSTLLRLLAGLLLPTGGTVRVLGVETRRRLPGVGAAVGYMPQTFGLYEELEVLENLSLFADLQGLARAERRDRFEKLLDFTGLEPFRARRAGNLSGGMKQKLGLACTLLRPPRLLLLDEPSVGVDPLSRRELWAMVGELVAEGTTAVWSTAYLDEAEKAREVLVLDKGRALYAGPPGAFTARAEGRSYLLSSETVDFRAAQRKAFSLPGVTDAVLLGNTLRLVTEAKGEPPRAAALFGDDAAALPVRPTPPRFEDAYVSALKEIKTTAAAPVDRGAYRVETAADGPAIATQELTRRFGDFTAVDRVSFQVRRGEVFGLLGPNGAGKSTIFKMLCGLLPPSGGEATVAGGDLRTAPAAVRSHLGYMAQHFSLYAELSVGENLRFFGAAYGLRGRALRRRIAEVSADFDLEQEHESVSGTLPLGLKQRLSIACALLHEPEILFLDEPTSGVDPLMRREFWTRINALAAGGVTVLVTTHFLEEAEYCDRLVILYQGRVIALGSPDEIKASQADPEHPHPTLEEAFVRFIQAGREPVPA